MDDVQHQYRVMFDNMAQGAFYQSRDGSLVDVNAAALAMFGLTREEFLRPALDPEWRVFRDDGSDLPQELYPSVTALRTGTPVRDFVAGVYNARRQILIWLNINAIPMFRAGESQPYQVFVTLHDISEQKRMNDIHLSRIHLMQFAHSHPLEEFMVEALDELERLTGSVIGFYHFFDAKERFVTLKAWSTRTASHFCQVRDQGGHYSVDLAGVWVECIARGRPVIHNDYPSLPQRRGLPEGHAPVLRELVVPVQRNGCTVAVLGIGNKPVLYTGADVHTASLFADLTWDIAERKQAETSLLQASRQYEILTNTAMDGYCVFDKEGRIVSVNETCCRMHGYPVAELLGKSLSDISAPGGEAELWAQIGSTERSGYARFETRHLRKGGRVIEVEISAAHLPESGLTLAFLRDITEQKQMQADLLSSENELKLANETLEQRVSRRTADLQAAIREQESFSYSVSHDLRAPLRHINSFSALLKEDFADLLPDEASLYLDRIRSASSKMGALIDHLLELSRVTRAEIVPVAVDLTELATATLGMLQETEPRRLVELFIEPGLAARGDRHLLSQLLGNLLQNAWKYTSGKEVGCIGFGRTAVRGQEAYFVSDNGAGFDMTYAEKLFQPFERLHGSEFEGVGIGLATAQRIVTRHGGKIWGEGSVERGATFYFTLPGGPGRDRGVLQGEAGPG